MYFFQISTFSFVLFLASLGEIFISQPLFLRVSKKAEKTLINFVSQARNEQYFSFLVSSRPRGTARFEWLTAAALEG